MQRDKSIDIAKGIGIVAVVIGHVTASPELRAAIFLWHMPLFFFLSGMLFTPGRPLGEVARARALSLLVPYAAFLMLLAVPHLLNAWKRGGADGLADFAATLLYGGRDLTGWFSVFWFMTCLYVTQVAAAALSLAFGRRGLMVCAGVSLAIAYGLQQFMPDLRTPGNVAEAAFALPIFLAGDLIASRRANVAVGTVAVLTLVAVAAGVLPSLDIKAQQYGLPVVTLIAAIACVLTALALAKMLTASAIGKVFAHLGAASIVVMFTHQAVQLVMLEKLHIESHLLRSAACLIVGVLAYDALRRFALTRAVFLGIWPITSASR